MAPTATGSKARWAPQARREACMDWSWAAACSVHGRGISWRPPAYSLLTQDATVTWRPVSRNTVLHIWAWLH